MDSPPKPWICAQLGSREHYAIPRVLAGGRLHSLITDSWVRPGSLLTRVPLHFARKLPGRYHPDLAGEVVHAFTYGRLCSDFVGRSRKLNYWDDILARNEWFQLRALKLLKGPAYAGLRTSPKGIFFAYSYAALELLKFFKELGWQTILGQLDPGPREEQIVTGEVKKRSDLKTTWQPAPARFWQSWHQEFKLADQIIVNSTWSKTALAEKGVPVEKMSVTPLAYETDGTREFTREYPDSFSKERPLQVLFLGQITLRKGIGSLLDAVELLKGQPVHFHLAGPSDIEIPHRLRGCQQFSWQGTVSRAEADRLYRESDVFILPTLSDGFGITQLEALAHGLPVIASRCCGEVVEHERNGWILDSVSGEAIAEVIQRIISNPSMLRDCAARASIPPQFTYANLRQELLKLESGK